MARLKVLDLITALFVLTHVRPMQSCQIQSIQKCPEFYLIRNPDLHTFFPVDELDKICGQFDRALSCAYSYGKSCQAQHLVAIDTQRVVIEAICTKRTQAYRQSASCFIQDGLQNRLISQCLVHLTKYTEQQKLCGTYDWVGKCSGNVVIMSDGCTARDGQLMTELVHTYLSPSRSLYGCPSFQDTAKSQELRTEADQTSTSVPDVTSIKDNVTQKSNTENVTQTSKEIITNKVKMTSSNVTQTSGYDTPEDVTTTSPNVTQTAGPDTPESVTKASWRDRSEGVTMTPQNEMLESVTQDADTARLEWLDSSSTQTQQEPGGTSNSPPDNLGCSTRSVKAILLLTTILSCLYAI